MKFESLNEGVRKWEFGKKDLDEIKEIMIDDPDFMECYISSPSTKQTYDENLDDFIYNFIQIDCYDDYTTDEKGKPLAHKAFIADSLYNGGTTQKLKSGKILDLDVLYVEYRDWCINNKFIYNN